MTFNEVGLKVRSHWTELNEYTNNQLANLVLNRYPKVYDLISSVARRVKETLEEEFESERWTEAGRLDSTKAFEEIRTLKLQNLHLADMVMEATERRIPITALHDIAVNSHAMEMKWEERRQALEAIRMAQLDQHRTLETLKNDLKRLHREEYAIETSNDPESVKQKDLKVVRRLIQMLEGDLDGRVRYLVPPANGQVLSRGDEDTDAGGSDSSQAQTNSVSAVSATRPGIGFRRTGDPR